MSATATTPTVPAEDPTPAAPEQTKKPRNVLGIVALVVAALGFVFAVMPGALIMGWVLLPIGFILGLVALFLRGKGKASATIAVILAVVGTIAGVITFTAVTANAFNDAFDTGAPAVTQNETATDAGATADETAADTEVAEGTRGNPYALGSTVSSDDWDVTINSVTLDATDAVMAENPYNDEPGDGNAYALVNITATYTGDESGMPALGTTIDYVTADGVTVDAWDSIVLTPDAFDSTTELYTDASVSGNIAFAVPAATADQGVLAVQASMFGDAVFVAVK